MTGTKRGTKIALALGAIGVTAATAQFVPMILAASHESGASAPSRRGSAPVAATSPRSVAHDFTSVSGAGAPPGDILAALAVPVGATASGHEDYDRLSGPFDRAVEYSTGLSAGSVISYYRSLLPRRGWKVSGTYPVPRDPGATEVLARRAGSDGNYWEVAVSAPSPGSASGPSGGRGSFQLRLQVVVDQA